MLWQTQKGIQSPMNLLLSCYTVAHVKICLPERASDVEGINGINGRPVVCGFQEPS